MQIKPSQERPWLKYYPKASRDAMKVEGSIYNYLEKTVKSYPDGKALYYYGTRFTYKEFLNKVDRCADAFYSLGIRSGEIVSFLSVATPESIFAMYGLNKIGAISNFIDPRMDAQRILDTINLAQSNVLVSLNIALHKVESIYDKLALKNIIVQSATDSLSPLKKIGYKLKEISPLIPKWDKLILWEDFISESISGVAKKSSFLKDDLAMITYTGGTTGHPKGVMLTNRGLNAMAESFRLSGVDHDPGDKFLNIMPIFASYGVGCGLHMPLSMKFENILIPDFGVDRIAKLVKKYKPNAMMAVPSFYDRLMSEKIMKKADLSMLKTTGCGGDTMNPGLEERFNTFLKQHGGKYPLSQGYGMSETSSAAAACFSDVYKDGSAGIPLLAATVGIFDTETGEELGYNQEGEICVTGDLMMKGYFNDEEETKSVMKKHADGNIWIHSGDLGYLDEDGFLFINGRIKRMIIRFDGHKIYPAILEGVLSQYEKTTLCAVVGIKDPTQNQGELPVGIIKLDNTYTDEEKKSMRREILKMCHDVCEERGRAADIIFVDEMPYTPMGKIDYKKLAKTYEEHIIDFNF